jgi:hypothetical protein
MPHIATGERIGMRLPDEADLVISMRCSNQRAAIWNPMKSPVTAA